jgi:hypothetical protein
MKKETSMNVLTTVTLETPITRKDSTISAVSITPAIKQAGTLRGLRLTDVFNMDFDAVAELLTRTTLPTLTRAEINTLDTPDFTELAQAIVPFLVRAEPGRPSAPVAAQ